jgi:hypothetical protein
MIRIRNKKHVAIILAGTLAAIAGAALYGLGFVGLGCVLLFCGTIGAAATNAHRECKNHRI